MSIDDFKKVYGRLKVASDVVDQHELTYRNLESAGILEQMLGNDTNIPIPRLREDSAKTRQAEVAKNLYVRHQQEILDYTKSNIDGILKDTEKSKLIRAAALGIQHDPKDTSDLAKYLFSYRIIELLKQEEEDIQEEGDSSKKRKKRLSGEQRAELSQMVLPLIVKERIRAGGKVPEKDLDFYASNIAYVAALSDRNYVANAMNEGQELLGKRIEKISGVDSYIKNHLADTDKEKENAKYLSFVASLGEAIA